MDNRVALAKVSFVGGADCFVGVSKNLARLLSSSASSSSAGSALGEDDLVVFELLFDKAVPPAYVSWSGEVVASTFDVLTVNAAYGESLGLTHGREVIVRPLPPVITPCHRLIAEPILSPKIHFTGVLVELLRSSLRQQIRILQPKQVIPICLGLDRVDGGLIYISVVKVEPDVTPIQIDHLTEISIIVPSSAWDGDSDSDEGLDEVSGSNTRRGIDSGGSSEAEGPHCASLALPFYPSFSYPSTPVHEDRSERKEGTEVPKTSDDHLRARLPRAHHQPTSGAGNSGSNSHSLSTGTEGSGSAFNRSLSQILDSVGSVESLVSLPYSSDEDERDLRLEDDEEDDEYEVNDSLVKKISDRLTPDPLLTNLFTAVSRELASNLNPISAAAAAAAASRDAIYGRFLNLWAAVASEKKTTSEMATVANESEYGDEEEDLKDDTMGQLVRRHCLDDDPSTTDISSSVMAKFWDVVSFMAPTLFYGVGAASATTSTTSSSVPGPGSLFSDNVSLASFNRFHQEILRTSVRTILRVQPMNDTSRLASSSPSKQRTPDLRARFSKHASLETGRKDSGERGEGRAASAAMGDPSADAIDKMPTRASSLAKPLPCSSATKRTNDADATLTSVSKFLFCGLKMIWRQPNTIHVHIQSLPSSFHRAASSSPARYSSSSSSSSTPIKSFIAAMSHIRPPYRNRAMTQDKLAAKLRTATRANLLSAADPTTTSTSSSSVGDVGQNSSHDSLLFTRYVRVIIEDDEEDAYSVPNNNNAARDILRPDDGGETTSEFPLPRHVMLPDWMRRHFSCGATDKLLVAATQNLPIAAASLTLELTTPVTSRDDAAVVREEDVIVRFRQWVSSISSEDYPFLVSNPTFVRISLDALTTLECRLTFEPSLSSSSSSSSPSSSSSSNGYCLIPPSQLTHLNIKFFHSTQNLDGAPPLIMPEDSLFGYPAPDPSTASSSSSSTESKWTYTTRQGGGAPILKPSAWSYIGLCEAFLHASSHLRLTLGLDPIHRVYDDNDDDCSNGVMSHLTSSCRGCLLLTGKKGVGKTRFAQSVAAAFASPPSLARVVWLDCIPLRGRKPDAVLREFEDKLEEAVFHSPSILVLEDLDALLPAMGDSDDGAGEMSMSATSSPVDKLAENVADALLATLRRRLDPVAIVVTSPSKLCLHESLTSGANGRRLIQKVVHLEAPATTENRKAALLLVIETRFLKSVSFETEEEKELAVDLVARNSEGFVARDMERIAERASHACKMRVRDNKSKDKDEKVVANFSPHNLNVADFESALDGFTPAALKGVALHTPAAVKWEDVGGLKLVKKKLIQFLEWPTKYPELLKNCPQSTQTGILLFGPPGTGKTFIAGAAAHECGLRFISVKGPELLSKYVGESEKAVRATFDCARAARPCLLFFDEFDSLAPRRGNDSTGVTDRVVNQLLTQLDGVEGRQGIVVLAATSRPDLVDPALLRPGRLGKKLFCPLPNERERLEILGIHQRQMPKRTSWDPAVNLPWVATFCAGFSGADLKALLYNAQMEAFDDVRRDMENVVGIKSEVHPAGETGLLIKTKHLDKTLIQTKPSVSEKEAKKYDQVYAEFLSGRDKEANNAGDTDRAKSIFGRSGQRQTLA